MYNAGAVFRVFHFLGSHHTLWVMLALVYGVFCFLREWANEAKGDVKKYTNTSQTYIGKRCPLRCARHEADELEQYL